MNRHKLISILLSGVLFTTSLSMPSMVLAAKKDKTPPVLSKLRVVNQVKVSIYFTLNENAILKVKVINSKKALVRTITSGQKVKKGPIQINWAKTDNKKRLVSPGKYTIIVSATDKSGNTRTKYFPVTIKAMDKTAPVLDNIVVSPNSFKNGEMITVIFRLSEKAKISLRVYNNNHEEVYKLSGDYLKAGENYVMWNGSMNGKFSGNAPAGTYHLELSATDESKNTSTHYQFSVVKK